MHFGAERVAQATPCSLQRPKSIAVLETPGKAQLRALASPPAPPASGDPTGDAGVQGSSTQPAPASHHPDTAVMAAAAAAEAQRQPGPGKSLSFSGALAGRFSALRPSKPSPFALLMRKKDSSSSGSDADAPSKGGPSRAQLAAAREAAAAAAVAQVDEEEGGQAGQAGQAAVHVRAVCGPDAVPGSPAASLPLCVGPVADACARPAHHDLIPAGRHGNKRSSAGDAAGPPQGGVSRGSLAAVFKSKLSSVGTGVFGAGAGGPTQEEVTAADVARSSCIGTIGAVQAPSIQQLLTPPAAGASRTGGNQLQRTSSGRRLLQAFGKKWSLGGRKDSAVASIRAAATQAAQAGGA